MIPRIDCALTGVENLEKIYTFYKFPIYMGVVSPTIDKPDQFEDMHWGYSPSSGSVQLLNLLPPGEAYVTPHNSGALGQIWETHHREFYNFINDREHVHILEIGGGSGNLARHALSSDKKFKWTIVDPGMYDVITDERVSQMNTMFEEFTPSGQFDAIIHSHVLEHTYSPREFLSKIHGLLYAAGTHYISIPNMRHGLENGFSNTLNFEHTYYIDECILEYLLAQSGFEILSKKINPHSIFMSCVKSKMQVFHAPRFDHAVELFSNYTTQLEAQITDILTKLQNRRCYLFGAHIFSQMLLTMGLDQDQVVSVLDHDVSKHGKRLYGSQLLVTSPELIEDYPIIVRCGIYTDEITEALLLNNPAVEII